MNLLRRFNVDVMLSSTAVFSTRRMLCSVSSPLTDCAQVMLKENKTKFVDDMNPFVYSHSIEKTTPSVIEMGAQCHVTDSCGEIIGRGVYNPESLYRVRMLALASESIGDITDPMSLPFSDLLLLRLKQAIALRHCVGLPSAETSVYRLVNGEGDRLSGLVVDVFNEDILIVQSSAAWTEKNRASIESSLVILYPTASVMWMSMASRLEQEGWAPVNNDKIHDGGNEKDFVWVIENGISYKVSPGYGQKTGFYCDQRDNRKLMKTLCKDKDVLDLFCNTGGFSLNALSGSDGSARRVVAVDSSEDAVETMLSNLERNFSPNDTEKIFVRNDDYSSGLNNMHAKVTVVKADVNTFLKQVSQHNEKKGRQASSDGLFDVIVCDPPKLAPKKTFLKKAMKRYVKINSAALRLLRPGGLLLTCSCSTVVAQDPNCFPQIIREAGRAANRGITVLASSSAGMDHPVHAGYSDGKHLSVVLAMVV